VGLNLVTGGAGFIGSHIAEELVKNKQKVRVIDNFSTGKPGNLGEIKDRIEIIKGDIRDEKAMKKALKGVDYVYHQAALRSVPRSVDDPLSTNDVNVTGTLLLLFLARAAGVKRVVYAASSSAYGDSPELPKKETQLPAPISPYAVSKLVCEYYCRVYSKIYGLETVSLRYFNVFGPRQDPRSEYAAVIPRFITLAMKDKQLEIHGDGLQSRDFSYIDNVVHGNLLAMKAKGVSGEVFNIACNERYSVIDIAETIGKTLDKKIKYKFLPSRVGDVKHTLADISKAEKYLGYRVKVDFKEGMRKTVGYFLNNNK
jgi:nucleoside-diphosphate-sugar epimerase